jgi:hypothetical protein
MYVFTTEKFLAQAQYSRCSYGDLWSEYFISKNSICRAVLWKVRAGGAALLQTYFQLKTIHV